MMAGPVAVQVNAAAPTVQGNLCIMPLEAVPRTKRWTWPAKGSPTLEKLENIIILRFVVVNPYIAPRANAKYGEDGIKGAWQEFT